MAAITRIIFTILRPTNLATNVKRKLDDEWEWRKEEEISATYRKSNKILMLPSKNLVVVYGQGKVCDFRSMKTKNKTKAHYSTYIRRE